MGSAVVEKSLVRAAMRLLSVLITDDSVLGDLNRTRDRRLEDCSLDAAVTERLSDLTTAYLNEWERFEGSRVP